METHSMMELLDVQQRPINVHEYHAMGRAGILRNEDRVELIDGRIISMSPIGLPHMRCVNKLTAALVGKGPFEVSVQNSVRLSNFSEPQPDLVLFRVEDDTPTSFLAADTLLVIEVADTSLAFDRKVKLPRYAAAGIPEVWIVDLISRRLETYRNPTADRYHTSNIHTPDDDVIIPSNGPLAVRDILPAE